jgi:hypothetical protein
MSDKPKPKLRVVGKEPVEHQTPDDPKPVNKEVLDIVTSLKAKAEAGELTGLVYVAAYEGDSVTPHLAGNCISYGILGALYALAASVAIDIAESIGTEDEPG